jgi:Zn-dependent peptidase ImmA (M78 family)
MKWVKDKTGRLSQRPHYLPDEIDDECERIIRDFLNKKYGKVEFPVKTDDLTVLIEQKADLDSYADLSGEPGEVEGVTEFTPRQRPIVRISGALSEQNMENRLRTTLTHEFGHVHFHQFMFDDLQNQPPSLFAQQAQAHTNKCHRDNMIGASDRDWMEWQAGYACGAILMPVAALLETVKRFREDKKLPYANLAAGSEHGQQLITMVTSTFQTSRDAARVRLLKRGVLADGSGTRTAELF